MIQGEGAATSHLDPGRETAGQAVYGRQGDGWQRQDLRIHPQCRLPKGQETSTEPLTPERCGCRGSLVSAGEQPAQCEDEAHICSRGDSSGEDDTRLTQGLLDKMLLGKELTQSYMGKRQVPTRMEITCQGQPESYCQGASLCPSPSHTLNHRPECAASK